MKFLLLFILLPFFAFAESGVSNNLKIAGNLQTSKNIVNGSFESGANTGWTVGAGTLTATTSEKAQGAQSGLWSITGAGTIDLCATPTNLANSDLVASGWVKSTSTDLQVCRVMGSVEGACLALGTVTGWKKFQATGNYVTGNFCFRLKSVAAGTITAYVDDVKIEPLEFPITGTLTQTPTIQKFTSGSGTYTLPTTNGFVPKYIRVRMVGGGGGGSGSGNTSTAGAGGAGGNTTFGTTLLSANGGNGGGAFTPSQGGSGGTASLGSGPIGTVLSGSAGSGGGYNGTTSSGVTGGGGGASPFGGAGGGAGVNGTAVAAIANSGSGGGGASVTDGATGKGGGAGGGSGGYVDALISNPSSTYSYSVGSAGSAGSAGTSGNAGGAGGSGYIEVTEYYF